VERKTLAKRAASNASSTPAALIGSSRFTLSYRDVEELLAERGLDIS